MDQTGLNFNSNKQHDVSIFVQQDSLHTNMMQ